MDCFAQIVQSESANSNLLHSKEMTSYMLAEVIQNGIIIINKNGYIIFFNNTAQKLTGFSQEYCMGKKISDIVSYIDIKKTDNLFHILGKPFNILDVSPIKPDDKKHKGFIIVFNDITRITNILSKKQKTDSNIALQAKNNKVFGDRDIDPAFCSIIGQSKNFKHVLYLATKAAKTKSTILLKGESGTGKSLIAKAIHYASNRTDGPFVKVSCPAIPLNLVESELFGHEKGSFTGAINQKIGKFELANGGTIFLDEIGELDKNIQAKLLRVIQEKEFERVGGNETFNLDVRIIAATNRNLEEMIKNRKFREDLYYRLNVVPITLPSLRERKEDVPILAKYFLKTLGKELGKNIAGITDRAMKYLVGYEWPGNIRELENIMERAINFTDSAIIDIDVLPIEITGIDLNKKRFLINYDIDGEIASFKDYEKEIIKFALKRYNSFNAAGKALGLTHKTVASKARKYGIV